jgi:hypothetical protein
MAFFAKSRPNSLKTEPPTLDPLENEIGASLPLPTIT